MKHLILILLFTGAVHASDATISWDHPGDATYNVFVATDPDAFGPPLMTTEHEYDVEGLAGGGTLQHTAVCHRRH